MDVPRSGTLLHSGKHAICFRRSTVYSTFSVSHSAEFCLFEAVYPLPFGHPLLQGGTRFALISILRGASIFLRRTTPVEPSELVKPAPPLSHAIKGRNAFPHFSTNDTIPVFYHEIH